MENYDVIIIGAGILGCFAARNLARFKLKTAVLEMSNDVCTGISKANTAIVYPGYDTKPGTLKSKLCVEGCLSMEKLCAELGVRYKKTGSLMVSFGPESHKTLLKKYAQGLENGVPDMSLLSDTEALALEPRLASNIYSALYCKNTATVIPWELGIAAYENAKENGVRFLFSQNVKAISQSNGAYTVLTDTSAFNAKMIINCAGIHADDIRELVFTPSVRIIPSKGDYYIFDDNIDFSPKHIIFCEPEEKSKGLTLVPTVTGNLLAGPTETDAADKYDTASTQGGLSLLQSQISETLPSFETNGIIRSFSALRPNPFHFHRDINGEYSPENRSINNFTVLEDAPSFISFIGIKTPGLTCCNGLGKLSAELAAAYLKAEINPAFSPLRTAPVRACDLDFKARQQLVKERPEYGNIVCRCRDITEGDIIDSVKRGAVSADAVKRRCEATSGRCQGSFCLQRIVEIIARETNIPVSAITKDAGSTVFQEVCNE